MTSKRAMLHDPVTNSHTGATHDISLKLIMLVILKYFKALLKVIDILFTQKSSRV